MKLPRKLRYIEAAQIQMPVAWMLFGASQARAVDHRQRALEARDPLVMINERHLSRLWAKSARSTYEMLVERARRDIVAPAYEPARRGTFIRRSRAAAAAMGYDTLEEQEMDRDPAL